ncbi:F-box/LRR-repeat protein At3g26922-like [Cornus florida]|uniref:F-box/LRR-repeat protein At3g26922-like n=1 Tax=Cornus florida TaxID=4283 RepID=UPI0028A08F55|nr:F-box/LRR-repeat protein At3g26922-like [Cornus florida]
MHSIYKKKVGVEGNEDRISNLPSCLIGHILSFLPIKEAVATGVLSTKWKYLWTSITNLDFDDKWLLKPIYSQKCTEQKLVMSFVNFVNEVLMRNMPDLHTFRLGCTWRYSHLNVWISTALARNLRELHLFFQRISYHQGLPLEVFTCTSLIVLELVGGFVLNVPTLVSLQNLKILLIQGLEFSDDDSIDRLFSGCPLLEELSVKRCNYRKIRVFHISAPVLKSLVINCYREGGYNVFNSYPQGGYKLVLNTPNLRNLEYNGYVGDAKSYSVDKLNALVNANIRFVLGDSPDRHYSVEGLVAEFVEGISKVQRLHFISPSPTVRLCRSPLPKFDHLICLEIGENAEWSLLLDFLERSQRLEKLIFRISEIVVCPERILDYCGF